MEFYQKLQKLRKENGMSQEELANHLNVSRQAVSKWENGQGYPETDKLLQISNLYNISVDYLLKEETPNDDGEPDDGSFYASREMVNSFLLCKAQGARQITLGVAILILSVVWHFVLAEGPAVILFFLQIAVGVAILVASGFRAKRYDERMETAPLVFDPGFIKEFRAGYQRVRKNAGMLIVAGIFCVILGVVFVVASEYMRGLSEEMAVSIMFIFIAGGVSMLMLGGMRLSHYSTIAENQKHVEELAEESRSGWIMGTIMMLAVALFLLSIFSGGEGSYNAMTLVGTNSVPAWAVFPVAAIVGVAITGVVQAVRKK